MLDEEDPCAILAILTHGGDGVVYGSDGNHSTGTGRVNVDTILGYLSNAECPKMAGKPKITLLQACQGGKTIALFRHCGV